MQGAGQHITPQGDRDAPVMFFVIGAQKSGTSWLHSYLVAHPQVSMGPIKEYHYFNKFHGSVENDCRAPRLQSFWRWFARGNLLLRVGEAKSVVSAAIAAFGSGRSYLDIVRGDQKDARAFGDVSPAYGILGADAFQEMRDIYPNTKFVFVMRDPVDRLWSNARMRARRKGYDLDAQSREYTNLLDRALTHPRMFGYSDYARTIEELERVVPSEDILYLFYETLFSDEGVKELCDFLGLDFVPGEYSTRVFKGLNADVSADWARTAEGRLSHVYSFVRSRFGDRVPAGWRLTGGTSAEGAA